MIRALDFIPIGIVILMFSACASKTESLEQRSVRISRAEMESVAELLGHDLFEGRAPGTRGGDLAPGWDHSYFQPFVMKGFSNSGFSMSAGGVQLDYIDDVVGTFTVEEESVDFNGDAVFVGFGITTDIWDWDDYKDVDVKNRIVITRVNDPGMYDEDIFEGSTLTYFGRWTYHIEEAARRGAAGILLIHTDKSAGYD